MQPEDNEKAGTSDFVTPVTDQGEVGATRDLPAGSSEIPPAEGETADQSSLGGTGGITGAGGAGAAAP